MIPFSLTFWRLIFSLLAAVAVVGIMNVGWTDDGSTSDWIEDVKQDLLQRNREYRFLLRHAEGRQLLEEQRELKRLLKERDGILLRDLRRAREELYAFQRERLEGDKEYQEARTRLAEGKASVTELRERLQAILGRYGVEKSQVYKVDLSREDIFSLPLNEREQVDIQGLLDAIDKLGEEIRDAHAMMEQRTRWIYSNDPDIHRLQQNVYREDEIARNAPVDERSAELRARLVEKEEEIDRWLQENGFREEDFDIEQNETAPESK